MRPATILTKLDEAWSELGWPDLAAPDTEWEVHTTRMLVYVRDKGDWMVIFEQLRGEFFAGGDSSETDAAKFHYWGCGSDFEPMSALGGIELPFTECTIPEKHKRTDPDTLEGCVLRTKKHALVCTDAMCTELDLRPGKVGAPVQTKSIPFPRFILMLRAWLARFPGSLYPSQSAVVDFLSFDASYDLLLASAAYEHVIATKPRKLAPELRPFAKKPSESPVFQSLANAIAERDASLFEPGESNLDWRRWALADHAGYVAPTVKKTKAKAKR